MLCITHLPQVAAHASRHLKVTKQHAADGRIKTNVEALEGDEARLAEVAAMMGVGSDMAAAEQIYRSARGVAANDAHPSVQ